MHGDRQPFTAYKSLLVTSSDAPNFAFDGYFFIGNDYVAGIDGLTQYSNVHEFSIRSGLDGCYVFTRRDAESQLFGTDFSGYRSIFYYHNGHYWAVSDSFAVLVDRLKRDGLQPVPNYAQLGAICTTNSTNNQLFSWDTPVRQVKLLPRGTVLRMTSTKAVVQGLSHPKVRDYRKGLTEHIETWVARYATLLSNAEIELSVDLTGGVDSRTNFALAQTAVKTLGSNSLLPRYTCSGTVGVSADATVAEMLCAEHGATVNPRNRVAPRRVSPEGGYQLWREKSLGVYFPLVIPANARRDARVHMSGGGGEVHRDYYVRSDVEDFFRGHARRNVYPWLGYEAGEAGRDAAFKIAEGSGVSPLRANYTEFRHRFHVGRAPRMGVTFTPLDSISAAAANSRAVVEPSLGAYFNVDVIGALDVDLLAIPFDTPEKAPSAALLSRIPSITPTLGTAPGTTWGKFSPDTPSVKSVSLVERVRPYQVALDAASDDDFVREFCGTDAIAKARGILASIASGDGIGNPVNGIPVSAVLSAHLVSPTRQLA